MNYEVIAWGLLLVWLGVRNLFPFLPNGTGMLGIGLILLGLNATRSIKGIPTKGFTTLLAAFALLWGGLELTNSILFLPFELPVPAVTLIITGLILLARGLRCTSKTEETLLGGY